MSDLDDFAARLTCPDQAALLRALGTAAGRLAPAARWRDKDTYITLTCTQWRGTSIAFIPSDGGGAAVKCLSAEGVVLAATSVLDACDIDDDLELLNTFQRYIAAARGLAR